MEGRATFLVHGDIAISVRFDASNTMRQEDMQNAAWSALVNFIDDNHVVVYSFEKSKAEPTESDSDSDK